MHVLVAPDKFKGTLTAAAAARAIARGWHRCRPQDELELLPISDGGDGFGEILGKLMGARRVSCRTVDAAHRPIRASWWWHAPSRTAVLESAAVIGLARLPKGRFHPFELDTVGLARVIKAAQRKGARKIIVGVGGSATNDGGFGLALGLGWKFFDRAGQPIERWTQLDKLARARPPQRAPRCQITVAVDVRNQLLGARGATRIYGPQKGLRPRDFSKAENCLHQLARVVCIPKARKPGAGAAGGLGFGLAAFLQARIFLGFKMFTRHARLNQRLRKADLVITGEGAMDGSTRMGKGVGMLIQRCQQVGVKCVAVAGKVTPEARGLRALSGAVAVTDYFSQTHAMQRPAASLEATAYRVSGIFGPPGV